MSITDGFSDKLADCFVVGFGGGRWDRLICIGVVKLTSGFCKVEVLTPDDNSATLVCRFDYYVRPVTQLMKSLAFSGSEVAVGERFVVDFRNFSPALFNVKVQRGMLSRIGGPRAEVPTQSKFCQYCLILDGAKRLAC